MLAADALPPAWSEGASAHGAHRHANVPPPWSLHSTQFVGAPGQDATTFMRKLRPVTEPKGALQQLLEHYEQAVRVEWGVGGVVNGPGV